mmetsp:Transcript_23328/g.51767  ORF Transcript_23328/g.51767 Transcript_23328/m.51767 type:complete len:254 (+) Transcript_23328:276-1037(+)
MSFSKASASLLSSTNRSPPLVSGSSPFNSLLSTMFATFSLLHSLSSSPEVKIVDKLYFWINSFKPLTRGTLGLLMSMSTFDFCCIKRLSPCPLSPNPVTSVAPLTFYFENNRAAYTFKAAIWSTAFCSTTSISASNSSFWVSPTLMSPDSNRSLSLPARLTPKGFVRMTESPIWNGFSHAWTMDALGTVVMAVPPTRNQGFITVWPPEILQLTSSVLLLIPRMTCLASSMRSSKGICLHMPSETRKVSTFVTP